MSALSPKLMDPTNHQQQQHMPLMASLQTNKNSNTKHFNNITTTTNIANNLNNINLNLNNLNNINNNHNNNNFINNNNNYATPTASSVLKQRKQTSTSTLNSTSVNSSCTTANQTTTNKLRKCPLSPLIITTNNAPTPPSSFYSNTMSMSMSSPSQHLMQPSPLAQPLQHFAKLSPTSPVLGLTLSSPLSPNSSSTCSSSVHLVRTTKTTRLRAAALGESFSASQELHCK